MIRLHVFDKIRDFLFPPLERSGPALERSPYERFAIPHSFKPQLSLSQAVIAAGGALLRIFFGSLLFAVWGTYSFLAWSTIPNLIWRSAVLLILGVLFAVLMTLLMLSISALVRMVWPNRQEPAKTASHL